MFELPTVYIIMLSDIYLQVYLHYYQKGSIVPRKYQALACTTEDAIQLVDQMLVARGDKAKGKMDHILQRKNLTAMTATTGTSH